MKALANAADRHEWSFPARGSPRAELGPRSNTDDETRGGAVLTERAGVVGGLAELVIIGHPDIGRELAAELIPQTQAKFCAGRPGARPAFRRALSGQVQLYSRLAALAAPWEPEPRLAVRSRRSGEVCRSGERHSRAGPRLGQRPGHACAAVGIVNIPMTRMFRNVFLTSSWSVFVRC